MPNNSKSGETIFKLLNKRKSIRNMPLKSKKPLKKKPLNTLLLELPNSTNPLLLNKPKNNFKKKEKKKPNYWNSEKLQLLISSKNLLFKLILDTNILNKFSEDLKKSLTLEIINTSDSSNLLWTTSKTSKFITNLRLKKIENTILNNWKYGEQTFNKLKKIKKSKKTLPKFYMKEWKS